MVTRESIEVIYSRYMYNKRECDIGSPADDPYRNGADPTNIYSGSPPTIYNASRSDTIPGRIFCVQPSPTGPDGFGAHGTNQDKDLRGAPSLRPDINVVTVQAKMWW